MNIHPLHSWDVSEAEAPALQKELAGKVDTHTPLAGYELVAGADVSYNRFSPTFYAAVVVLRASDWGVVEVRGAVRESHFRYVPGLLSFREAPVLLDAFAKVRSRVEVVMIDGQGIAHQRRLGIAAHVGLWLQVPCLGCAKSLLHGRHEEVGEQVGSTAPLRSRGEVIGEVVRTKKGAKPVYVSVGHRIDLPSAVRLVLAACRGYRLPEPTRQAHLHVNDLRRRGGVEDPEA
jgi:deoxyribonuclease V